MMKRLLSLLSLLPLLLLVVGCHEAPVAPPAKGEFSFSVRWPARVQAIPLETVMIRVRITKGLENRGEVMFIRPADAESLDTNKKTVSLNAETGLSVKAEAFTDEAGTGAPIATALVTNLAVIPNQRVPVALTLVPVN